MKIIYLKNQGGNKRGAVKDVAEGYARNFLLPQGLALLATPENLAKIKQGVEKQAKTQTAMLDAAQTLAEKIRGRKVEVTGKANESGKLYAAVSEIEIKTALKRLGFDIKDAKVIFPGHLKEAGEFPVKIDFGHGIVSEIIVIVRV